MTPVEQEVARQRARLLAIERQHTREILRSYGAVAARMAVNLKALTDLIEQATAQGVEVRPGWLFAQHRYAQLIHELRAHTDSFLAGAAQTVADGQRAAVDVAFEDGKRLARLALGPAPRAAVLTVTGAWGRLAAPAMDTLLGRASDGTPLAHLLQEIAPLAPEKVKDTLAFGVAAGKHPRVIALEVQQAAQVTPNRALVIARTEMVGAHREAVTETWRQTGIVQTWRWQCARDARTCAACWAMDDSEHPIDEPMGSHPCCRCGRIPQTPSWEALGFAGVPDRRPTPTSGAEVFAALSDADKLAVLGRAKLDAYNNGDITLADLLRRTHSDRWGPGIRVANLTEALA